MKEKGVASFDRRLRRIERWLRRLMSACGCGEWSSALMEVECMEAETKELRDDLWRTVENEVCLAVRRSLTVVLAVGARVSLIAMLILLSSAFPLSVDQDRPQPVFSMEPEGLSVNREGEILNALKRTLSGGNRGRAALYADASSIGGGELTSAAKARESENPAAERQRTSAKVTAEPTEPIKPTEKPGLDQTMVEAEKIPARHEPSLDDVISLIQVGQRALRVSERAVSVYP
ncbi:MAG: hypothetical protein LBI74_04445 [Synergistaceae bacterium]|nr:hypothetical protein [Synergistaceae bacterium]